MLAGSQRVLSEMRDDKLAEWLEASDLPLQRFVASVGSNRAAAEISLNLEKYFATVTILTD